MGERIDLTPLPPLEAIAYFRSKGYAPQLQRFDWRDHWREEHARAFTVAKALDDEVLADIRGEIDKALSEGLTLDQFRKSLRPMLEKRGWWGQGIQRDPADGELKEVRLGTNHRLRVIYDTNMRTSLAAGRWERIQRTKAAFPYLEYRQIERDTKRDDHEPYHGLIRPVDDPIWLRIFPPNSWFCGCSVRQLNDRMLKREGKTVSEPFDLDEEPWLNKRTGETEPLPKGIHPGFDTNPGATWLNIDQRHAATRGDAKPQMQAVDRALMREVRAYGFRTRAEMLAVYDLDANPTNAVFGVARAAPERPNVVGFTPAMNEAFSDPDRRMVALHNHPSGFTFSDQDVETFLHYPGLQELSVIGADGSVYRMIKNEPFTLVRAEQLRKAARSFIMQAAFTTKMTEADAKLLSQYAAIRAVEKFGGIRYLESTSGRWEGFIEPFRDLITQFLNGLD